MRTGLVGAVFVAIALAGPAGCAPPPPPVLAHADTTAGVRVHITDTIDYLPNPDDEHDDESRKAIAGAQKALVARLTEAGYVCVDKGAYDVWASTSYRLKRPPHEDLRFTTARLRLKDRKGDVVDEITLEYRNNAAPAVEPDRVAISLINEMNKSPKLGTLAQKRGKSAPSTAPTSGITPVPGAPPEPTSPATPTLKL